MHYVKTEPVLEDLRKYFIQRHLQLKKDGHDEWSIVKGSVAIDMFSSFYVSLVKDGVIPIEKLPEEQKQKYWDISGKYFTDKDKRILVSKAAYVIELITNIDEEKEHNDR